MSILSIFCSAWLGLASLSSADPPAAQPAMSPQQLMQAFEIKPLKQRPAWAPADRPALFTFAWLSDMHLHPGRFEAAQKALHMIRDELKPRFVVITGDNNAHAEPGDESHALRRQRFFKAFLDEHLQLPYAVIPGDNWPYEFEKVFGPSQYSFDCGGLHLQFLSLDRADHRTEGLAIYNDETWQWIEQDLQRNRDRPTIVLQHEPILPPTFLDAGRLRRLLDRYPNVLAGLHGHMHHDLESLTGGRPYLMCPALGPGQRPGFKLVSVHRHALIVETYEYDKPNARFVHASKWQKIDVPKALRAKLFAPAAPFERVAYDAVPAHPHLNDPELGKRKPQLNDLVLSFLRRELPKELARLFREANHR